MTQALPLVEAYSSMECPYAYLATYRLRQIWPDYDGKVLIVWRVLALEYVNQQTYPKPLFDAERGLFQQIEPKLTWNEWSRPDWQWPSTFWPAYEALACAQAQSGQAAMEMSWALRHAFFAQSRCLSLRHEVFAVADEVAAQGFLDLNRFKTDWDSGHYKSQIAVDSQRGWHEVKAEGSLTFRFPNGQQVTNPAVGDIDFDEEQYRLNRYRPFAGDPLDSYRELLDRLL